MWHSGLKVSATTEVKERISLHRRRAAIINHRTQWSHQFNILLIWLCQFKSPPYLQWTLHIQYIYISTYSTQSFSSTCQHWPPWIGVAHTEMYNWVELTQTSLFYPTWFLHDPHARWNNEEQDGQIKIQLYRCCTTWPQGGRSEQCAWKSKESSVMQLST